MFRGNLMAIVCLVASEIAKPRADHHAWFGVITCGDAARVAARRATLCRRTRRNNNTAMWLR
jgi:hypothetical protein